MRNIIPRDSQNDHSREIAAERRRFIKEITDTELSHTGAFSFDPGLLKGNIENFFGVAQVPIGLAGPLLIHGEHAQGEFFVPLATTEGTLVASYNRGMKLIYECGGVTTTIVDDAMQRAPVFMFDDARGAKKFGVWVREKFDSIRKQAEATTSVGKLRDIEQYGAGKLLFLRFNYTTGDAAGQNMVGKATLAACEWLKANFPGIRQYTLSGNFDTDKKSSYVNTLHTRGKRVIAEVVIPAHLFEKISTFPVKGLMQQRNIINIASFMAGSNNNGVHSANGITAMFIATGQDVANVAESSAAVVYTDITPDNDYYYSITIPSLIVGTYGGGTGNPTQRECLEILGCYGAGKVNKFAEIVAATVLCGELSLVSAILAGAWVSSHEKYGRNR